MAKRKHQYDGILYGISTHSTVINPIKPYQVVIMDEDHIAVR